MAIPPGSPAICAAICRPRPVARALEAAAAAPACMTVDRPERLADRADPLEPGVAREIIACRAAPSAAAAQAGPEAIVAPAGDARRRSSSSIDTRTRGGSVAPGWRQRQPDRRPSPRDVSTRSTVAANVDDHRPVEPRLRDPRRARPDQCAAERRGEREPAERPPARPLPSHEADQRRAPRARTQEGRPLRAAGRARTRPRSRRRTRRPATAEAARARASRSLLQPLASREIRVFQ